MDADLMKALAQAGAISAMAISAIGSTFGAGASCSAAIGAWKKCYVQNKPVPFTQLVIFGGAPLTQTIYGMLLMLFINAKLSSDTAIQSWPLFIAIGLVSGTAIGLSAWKQGCAAAGCCDSFAETEKGFANDMVAIGIIETVAIFVLVFSGLLLASVK
jgi:V/A-type H+-transporting ATPase subunit K